MATRQSSLTQWLLLFTLSGVGWLIFQVLWIRALGLFIGSTIQSAALASSSFLLGLSLGAYVVGRWSAKTKRIPVLTNSSENHWSMTLDRPLSFQREMELARIAYLRDNSNEAVQRVDSASNLASGLEEKQLAGFIKLLLTEDRLTVSEQRELYNQISSMPSGAGRHNEFVKQRWGHLQE